ncbi:hypothetical protein LAZ29_01385, partial [Cereibacter sphaeroides]|nr:hypothetical protein [Cereibacter sphaeroides]
FNRRLWPQLDEHRGSQHNRDRRLVDIQPDEHGILHVVSPPFFRVALMNRFAALGTVEIVRVA